jgi:DNA/RNA-binding domain of Phe-tRNA-synthetase-like protein
MNEINLSERWRATFPGAHMGVLLIGKVDNTARITPLEDRKRALETTLRERFTGLSRAELHELEVLRAYRDYYKQFSQTYHVQLQLESVVHKGKSLPTVNPITDASFIAELETLILTASHDADQLEWPLTIDATGGGEAFTQMNGAARTLKPGDMMMTDAVSIVCTILLGQDARTPITSSTTRALFVSYAPAGVKMEIVQRQLELIREHVLVFAPEAILEMTQIFAA